MDELVKSISFALDILNNQISRTPLIFQGSGTPESQVPAAPGAFYFDQVETSGYGLYFKQYGLDTTGWVRISAVPVGSFTIVPATVTISLSGVAPTLVIA